jgi:hypothetical protein
VVKSTLAKLAVNVDIFIARLEAQRSSNVQDDNQESDRDFNAARNIPLKNMILVFKD